MQVRILAIAKKSRGWAASAEVDFLKRLKNFAKIKIELIPPVDENSLKIQKVKKIEAQKILAKIADGEFIIACERQGRDFDSPDFAKKLLELRDASQKICFVIGGSHGLGGEVWRRANLQISFSKLTFPHELFRILLLEQIYRAFTILANRKYHK
ncbi:MAG: 23S rRNA (pseudouridine(1915)-N(3))-methyltransferase RlmH [Patescibacteria group bacterium]